MTAEALSIIAGLAGTVSVLASLYAATLRSRITQLEQALQSCDKKNNRLASLIVTAGSTTEGVEEMRRELARLLEAD